TSWSASPSSIARVLAEVKLRTSRKARPFASACSSTRTSPDSPRGSRSQPARAGRVHPREQLGDLVRVHEAPEALEQAIRDRLAQRGPPIENLGEDLG